MTENNERKERKKSRMKEIPTEREKRERKNHDRQTCLPITITYSLAKWRPAMSIVLGHLDVMLQKDLKTFCQMNAARQEFFLKPFRLSTAARVSGVWPGIFSENQ